MTKMEYLIGKSGIKMKNNFVDVFGSGVDKIKTVENFMDTHILKAFNDFMIDMAKEHGHKAMHLKDPEHFELPEEFRILIKFYDQKVFECAKEAYKMDFVDGPATDQLGMVIHTIGSSSDPHTDILEAGLAAQSPGADEFVGWRDAWDGYLACNIYVNDNYSGGQVYFPEIPYEFKPKANTLVMWAGNKNFIHGVRDPLDANRFTITKWIKFKDFDKYNILT